MMAATYELIASTTLGSAAANIEFTSIPATFTDLLVVASLRNTATNAGVAIRINSDTGANYSYRGLYGTGSSAGSFVAGSNTYAFAVLLGTESTANVFGNTHIYIPNYAGSTNKSLFIESTAENNGTTSYIGDTAALWSNTAAITALRLLSDPGATAANLAANSSAYLYGITKA